MAWVILLTMPLSDLKSGVIKSKIIQYFGCIMCTFYNMYTYYNMYINKQGQAVVQLVEALHYKLEGRRIDSRWCHWNFSLT
jgi:hypothetical protein